MKKYGGERGLEGLGCAQLLSLKARIGGRLAREGTRVEMQEGLEPRIMVWETDSVDLSFI